MFKRLTMIIVLIIVSGLCSCNNYVDSRSTKGQTDIITECEILENNATNFEEFYDLSENYDMRFVSAFRFNTLVTNKNTETDKLHKIEIKIL